MELLFRYHVRSLNQAKETLTNRDNMVEFDVWTSANDLEKNIKLQQSPSDLQEKVKEVVTAYWDVFYEDGFLRPIHWFSFQVVTGDHPPICFKQPR